MKNTKEQPKSTCIQTGLPCGVQCLSEETCNMIKPKQETLEEACKRIKKELDYSEFDYTSFKLGIKYQEEKSYSEEDFDKLISLLKQTTEYEVLQSFRDKVEQFKTK
jgi:hypothetical protein